MQTCDLITARLEISHYALRSGRALSVYCQLTYPQQKQLNPVILELEIDDIP